MRVNRRRRGSRGRRGPPPHPGTPRDPRDPPGSPGTPGTPGTPAASAARPQLQEALTPKSIRGGSSLRGPAGTQGWHGGDTGACARSRRAGDVSPPRAGQRSPGHVCAGGGRRGAGPRGDNGKPGPPPEPPPCSVCPPCPPPPAPPVSPGGAGTPRAGPRPPGPPGPGRTRPGQRGGAGAGSALGSGPGAINGGRRDGATAATDGTRGATRLGECVRGSEAAGCAGVSPWGLLCLAGAVAVAVAGGRPVRLERVRADARALTRTLSTRLQQLQVTPARGDTSGGEGGAVTPAVTPL
ncbi:cuticle collagen 1-like [Chamaea fasciata]|uniref:cuticle collagen 1-like n=1 Tax=Chamaea fasciata TaxID=190680 RepID=UPI00336A9590